MNFDLNKNIKPLLAIMVVSLGFGYFFMCSIRNINPNPQILIAIVGSLGTALGYFFGSSQGSSKKDEALVGSVSPTAITETGDINVKK